MVAFRALVFLAVLSCCLAANFVMFPMFGRSHYMFVARLGRELAERGHQVCKLIGAILIFRTNKGDGNWLEIPAMCQIQRTHGARMNGEWISRWADLDSVDEHFVLEIFVTSLRIQPPLIRFRYYMRNHVVAGANERRLYSLYSQATLILICRISRYWQTNGAVEINRETLLNSLSLDTEEKRFQSNLSLVSC